MTDKNNLRPVVLKNFGSPANYSQERNKNEKWGIKTSARVRVEKLKISAFSRVGE